MKARVLFATGNLGKVRELRLLVGDAVDVLSLKDVPPIPEPVEDGETFQSNAEKKALAYARAAGFPALSDDSGLCVDALEGRPGVQSARYGPGDDRDRCLKLLRELEGVPEARRTASFFCALCLAWPDGERVVEVGGCKGLIALAPRGEGGFGYDPVFWIPALGKTLAELSPEEKSGVSHRGAAFRKMRGHLLALS